MLISYAKGAFPQGYVPTVFDNYAVTVSVDSRPIQLTLFDTAGTIICKLLIHVGQEDYDRLRPLSYSNANVFLLCFSISNRASFENVQEKWVKELKKYANGVPIVLVGTQSDRRAEGVGDVVTEVEARRVAKQCKCEYVECSARTRDGLKEVFFTAITTAIMPPKRHPKSKCVIC